MPKKENQKAVAARARKEGAAAEKDSKAKKAAADAEWQITDKAELKNLKKKEEEAAKKAAAAAKRAELKALEAEDAAKHDVVKPVKQSAKKSVAEIERERAKAAKAMARGAAAQVDEREHWGESNPNHEAMALRAEMEEKGIDYVEASGLSGAMSALGAGGGDGEDKHPEKRMKAAYLAFEEKMVPIIRGEAPKLKRSQIKERIWNLWQKSPENPMNQ